MDNLYQQGCCKVRFPRTQGEHRCEAVLINTAGGLTDGDQISVSVDWLPGTHAIVTSQAAERIYKSRQREAVLKTDLKVSAGAQACWIPQETILFDAARYRRETNIQLQKDAEFFGIESLILGRAAMGEKVINGSILEHWNIHLDGKLIFTDRFQVNDQLHGDIQAHLNRAAIGRGASAMATLVYAKHDCGERLSEFRSIIDTSTLTGGASCLGPLVLMRLLASSSREIRDVLIRLYKAVHRDTIDIPRVWNC